MRRLGFGVAARHSSFGRRIPRSRGIAMGKSRATCGRRVTLTVARAPGSRHAAIPLVVGGFGSTKRRGRDSTARARGGSGHHLDPRPRPPPRTCPRRANTGRAPRRKPRVLHGHCHGALCQEKRVGDRPDRGQRRLRTVPAWLAHTLHDRRAAAREPGARAAGPPDAGRRDVRDTRTSKAKWSSRSASSWRRLRHRASKRPTPPQSRVAGASRS